MNDPALYVAYFDGGWLDLGYAILQMAVSLTFIGLYLRERRTRRAWQPMIETMQRAIDAHAQACRDGERRDAP